MNTQFSFNRPSLKLALTVFAVCAGTLSDHGVAAVGSASASGTVIAPIGVTKTADLSFGTFATGTGGSITISTSGVRTVSGVVPSSDGSAMSAATFVISGDKGATFSISHGGTSALARTSGSETMVLTKFSDLTAGNTTTGTVASGTLTTGTQSIHIGGTLNVAANQAPGAYTGQLTVTVEYN
jgi:hypothetical protein